MKRVRNGPGDDPEEYWFECPDCQGNGTVVVDFDDDDEDWFDEDRPVRFSSSVECGNCDGLGFVEGDASDVS